MGKWNRFQKHGSGEPVLSFAKFLIHSPIFNKFPSMGGCAKGWGHNVEGETKSSHRHMPACLSKMKWQEIENRQRAYSEHQWCHLYAECFSSPPESPHPHGGLSIISVYPAPSLWRINRSTHRQEQPHLHLDMAKHPKMLMSFCDFLFN